MADTFGTLTDPAAAPAAGETVTDRALDVLLAFSAAVLTEKIGAAWSAVAPGKAVVARVYPWDPEAESFTDKDLPALFGWRSGGKPPTVEASDWLVQEDTITMQWVLPPTAQARSRIRAPILSGWAKMLEKSLYTRRETAYVAATDTDPLSRTYAAAPTAVMLARATSTGAQMYTGAALDGLVGGAAISPPRGITVTLGGSPGAFADGSTITITGTDVLGGTQTRTLTIAAASVPYTLATPTDFRTVTGVSVDAQAGTGGTIAVGTAARRGYGSPLLETAGALGIWPIRAAMPTTVQIKFKASSEVREYHAIEFQIGIRERYQRDPAQYGLLGAGGQGAATAAVTQASDGRLASDGQFPPAP